MQVLAINCAVPDAADVALWQPVVSDELASDGAVISHEQRWLPWALGVQANPDTHEVEVVQADSVDTLPFSLGEGGRQADTCVYLK